MILFKLKLIVSDRGRKVKAERDFFSAGCQSNRAQGSFLQSLSHKHFGSGQQDFLSLP
jgi:hypothetical protein